MTSHVYITINLFNLCQQSFLPFYIYFFKCWHRLNEPIIGQHKKLKRLEHGPTKKTGGNSCLSQFSSTWVHPRFFCVFLLCVFTFCVPCCDVRNEFHIKKRCSVCFYLQFFVGGLMAYLRFMFCLSIVVSNTYCFVFLLCLSLSYVPYVVGFSRLSIFEWSTYVDDFQIFYYLTCFLKFVQSIDWSKSTIYFVNRHIL